METVKILSIDGGGIRGIIPGTILTHLEKKIKEKTNNNEKGIAEYFDLVSGTSTGGILSCALLCPGDNNHAKYSAQAAVDFYFKRGNKIFASNFVRKLKTFGGLIGEKYVATPIEDAFKEYFGDVKLTQLLKPCLITSYDITERKAVFFNSSDAKNEYTDFYVRDVARGTSAAPTYFQVANATSLFGTPYPLIDGGVFANNPTMCAFVEATKLFPDFKLKDTLVVSIGTGQNMKDKMPFTYQSAKNWGIAKWIKPLLDIMMSANSETVNYQLMKLFRNAGCPQGYYRLESLLINAVSDMDNATDSNMQALKQDAGHFIAENGDLLDEIVGKIIA